MSAGAKTKEPGSGNVRNTEPRKNYRRMVNYENL